jgi:RNA recognition motif-containing protein
MGRWRERTQAADLPSRRRDQATAAAPPLRGDLTLSTLPTTPRTSKRHEVKVFVGEIPWRTNATGLRRHFEKHSDVRETIVIIDSSSGRSKGYGFVTFWDSAAADRALLDPFPVIEGRRAFCNVV